MKFGTRLGTDIFSLVTTNVTGAETETKYYAYCYPVSDLDT